MSVKFIYDMQDHEVIGPNPTLVEEQPARFRNATQAEIDAHHKKYGPPLKKGQQAVQEQQEVSYPEVKPVVLGPPAKKPLSAAQKAHIEKLHAARLAKKTVKEQVSA